MAASDESYMRRIGNEVRKTARRINAINELIIPRLKEQLQYISRALEEREREDVLRLKRLKNG
jgi:V/A-type H+-transporting ATPase subunit D